MESFSNYIYSTIQLPQTKLPPPQQETLKGEIINNNKQINNDYSDAVPNY
jgi:hypothetical protein